MSKTKQDVASPTTLMDLTVHDIKQANTSIDMDNKIDQAITQFYIQKEEEQTKMREES